MASFIVSLFSLIWTRFLRALFVYLGSYFSALADSAHIIFREIGYVFLIFFFIFHGALFLWWRFIVLNSWFVDEPRSHPFHVLIFVLCFLVISSWFFILSRSFIFIPTILDLWHIELPFFTRASLLTNIANIPPNSDLVRVAYNSNLDTISIIAEPPTQELPSPSIYGLSLRSFCVTRLGLAVIVGGILVGVGFLLSRIKP